MLGCLLYLFTVRNNRTSLIFRITKDALIFSIVNVFTMLPKNELKVSAIFASYVVTLPPSESVILFISDPFFSLKNMGLY